MHAQGQFDLAEKYCGRGRIRRFSRPLSKFHRAAASKAAAVPLLTISAQAKDLIKQGGGFFVWELFFCTSRLSLAKTFLECSTP